MTYDTGPFIKESGNQLLPLHGLCFLISSKESFICTFPRQDITYRGLPTPVKERKEGRKERRKFLFNDALNTFYLWLYGVRHMVMDHSNSERGNPLPPHGLLFLISSKGSFICTIPDRIAHTTAFVIPVMEHWLE